MSTEQPKALMLADDLEAWALCCERGANGVEAVRAAAELRRLHALVAAHEAEKATPAAETDPLLPSDLIEMRWTPPGALVAIPHGFALVPSPITEAMHVAACKVLTQARGLDGTPQRVLDAMLDTAPAAPLAPAAVPRESDRQLMAFYGASDMYGLIDTQEHHIKKLQAKLTAAPAAPVAVPVWQQMGAESPEQWERFKAWQRQEGSQG